MFSKQYRTDMIYLLWFGEAMLAGHKATDEEWQRFIKCREHSIKMAKVLFRITDEDFAYKAGKTFQER